MDQKILDNIIEFANADEDVRVVILEGSVATKSSIDELSDYDINIFSDHYEKYLDSDEWMWRLGEVLIYQKEQFPFDDHVIPTRLVLFRNGTKVDFSFWRLPLLARILTGESTYETYKNGYIVLVDKEQVGKRLPEPRGDGFMITKPDREEFLLAIYNFWFEGYCVAKYLSRGDLWYAKMVENRYIKDHLLQMMIWHHHCQHDWTHNPLIHTGGKRLEQWADRKLTESISRCFSGYDLEATWRSLLSMMMWFNSLAKETSLTLDIEYPSHVERNMLKFLRNLKARYFDEGQEGC